MLGSLMAFFELGTFGFWLLMVGASIIFTAGVASKRYIMPLLLTIALSVLYHSVFKLEDWRAWLVGAIAYVLLGIGWSLLKWNNFVKKEVKKFKESTTKHRDTDYFKRTMTVSDHAAEIISWIGWWPWSLFWTLTGDFFTMVYENMKSAYDKILNRHLSGLDEKE
jgi:hypothetical protein